MPKSPDNKFTVHQHCQNSVTYTVTNMLNLTYDNIT